MSASWLPRNRMRAVIDCMVTSVIRCSTVAAAVVTMLPINVSWVASGRPQQRPQLFGCNHDEAPEFVDCFGPADEARLAGR